jgi:hypothetical protein
MQFPDCLNRDRIGLTFLINARIYQSGKFVVILIMPTYI